MRILIVLMTCLAVLAGHVEAATRGGTVVANTATATYLSPAGETYASQSNTINLTVNAVASLTVTPKQTQANPATDTYTIGTPFTRRYTITNTSNIPDAYKITSIVPQAGKVTSAAFVSGGTTIPIVIGTTISPTIAPGGSIDVVVTLDGSGVASGTAFSIALTASTTVTGTSTGLATDSGETWAVAANPASFVNPSNPQTPIAKLVNGQPSIGASPGGTVTFSVTALNAGGVTATNAIFDDPLPSGLTADPTSVTINGNAAAASLNGQDLKVPLGTVAGGATVVVAFKATVAASSAIGTVYSNIASFSADNAALVKTAPATVLTGVYNIVYDGARGGNTPIAGASVSVLDAITLQPVPLAGQSIAPNVQNQNPYTTLASGAYSFGLAPPAAGATAKAVGGFTNILSIAAPGYLNRRIRLEATPNISGNLYHVTLTSLDGQPLATPGGYALSAQGDVAFGDVYGFFGNLPMFRPGSIQVSKTSDRTVVAAGDRIIYTVTVSATDDMGATTIVDTLPPGVAFAPSSAQLNGVATQPVVSGRTLTWSLPSLPAGTPQTIVYAAVVVPPVEAQTTLTNSVTATSGGISATATASVQVVGGFFSYRIDILGRVFADLDGTHHMSKANAGVAGVRVYLEDGTSVLTDKNGRFTLPSVRPGQHVLRLDETTLPAGLRIYAGSFPYDDPRSKIRLVHGLLDTSLPQDVNFAVEPVQ
jgi:uncharacterized repeat protein (TIGR01451 family)